MEVNHDNPTNVAPIRNRLMDIENPQQLRDVNPMISNLDEIFMLAADMVTMLSGDDHADRSEFAWFLCLETARAALKQQVAQVEGQLRTST